MKYGRNYGINGMGGYVLAAFLISASTFCRGADAPFPFADNKLSVLGIGLDENSTGPKAVDSAKAILVSDGMTLKALVNDLGPGYCGPFENCGILRWHFEDGRILYVWPAVYTQSEVIPFENKTGRPPMWWSKPN